jgi:hypothetical protein
MVLEWNTPAIKFYDALGAELLGEWETMLLWGEPLQRLANGAGVAKTISGSETIKTK